MLSVRSSPTRLRTAKLAAFLTLTVVASHAQTAPDTSYVPTSKFDVATIRESPPVTRGQLRVNVVSPVHGSTFEATNFTAKSLIQLAYGFGTPISGGPEWMSTRYFTVQAKSDAAMDNQMAKLTDAQARLEKQHMLQALLEERLGLKVHMETKDASVYMLVVAKNGPKLQEVKAETSDGPERPKSGTQATDVKATGTAQGLEFEAQGTSIKAIAAMLVSQIEAPVIDKTGLTGTYEFTLKFGHEWSARNPESWPDIFTAVQEQIGLKLEPNKAAVPVLVIDHLEPPSAN